MMALRDHALAKAPYLLAAEQDGPLAAVPRRRDRDAEDSPLVGIHPAGPGAVIDPDVLWSCTTCGACVEQCPVDIEHVDHIVDMRRHQVLMEGAFPEAAGLMLRNLEHAGDPWGRGASMRLEWAEPLPFEVRVLGADGEERIPDDVEYLFWVGCAGALDDKAQRTTRAVAKLLHEAGVAFMVLGEAETCTGDPARRMGHEFLFQMLAQTEHRDAPRRSAHARSSPPAPHCFNTFANEYPQLGGTYDVVHHTQLLATLVDEGRLTPVSRVETSDHLPRPLLPRPPQPRLRPAARAPRQRPGRDRHGDAAQPGAVLLLRRRRGPDVDGRDHRHSGSTRTAPTRRSRLQPDTRHRRLPVLHRHAHRRRAPAPAAGSRLRRDVEVTDVSEVLLRSVRPDLAGRAPPRRRPTPHRAKEPR